MARSFNGTSDRIDFANVAETKGSALTISAWINPDVLVANGYIFVAHDSGNISYGLVYNAVVEDIDFVRHASVDYTWVNGTPPTGDIGTGVWQLYTVTSNGGTLIGDVSFYKNGTALAVSYTGLGSGTETAHSGLWSIGGRYYSDTRNFDGNIAEVAVWNRALGTAEIASLAAKNSAQSIGSGLIFCAPLDLDYINTVTGVAGTADGTGAATHPTLYYPTTPTQQNQAQVSDAAPVTFSGGGGEVGVTAAENNQAQVSDAATLGARTPIAPSQQNQAQVSDAASPTVSNPYIVDDIVLEWVAVTQTVTPSQQNQAQVSDAVTLGAYTPITAADNNQAQVSDAASLTAQAPTYNVTVTENNQAQVSDTVTFGVIHPISAAENNQAQVSDAATITSGEVAITAADNRQAQVSDAVTISAYYPITPADCNQSQSSDACVLGVIYPITVTENNQAQVSDAASVTYSGADTTITGADNNQAQVIDPASLTAIYILAAIENNQAQKSDLAVVTIGGVIEHGARRLNEFPTRPTHAFKTRANLEVDD